MRIWVAYTYADGYPTTPKGVYLSEQTALAEPGIERWYRVQGGWRGFTPDGVAWEVEAWDVLSPGDEQYEGDNREHDQDGDQHGAAIPAVGSGQSRWPQPGCTVRLRSGREWVGEGEVIGPVGGDVLGDTDISARWMIEILHHPTYRAGDKVNFHYLDILGYMPTFADPQSAVESPITFIVRAGMMPQCGQALAALLECVKLRAAGILLIPEEIA